MFFHLRDSNENSRQFDGVIFVWKLIDQKLKNTPKKIFVRKAGFQ